MSQRAMPEIGIEALKRKQAEDLAANAAPVSPMRAAVTKEPPKPAPAKARTKSSGACGERAVRPDRVGKKMVTAYLPAEQVKALRHLAVDRDTTVQALIEAALAALLAEGRQRA